LLPIGAVAERTGLAVSAVRFYEQQGLIAAERASSGHRRFPRSTIRRVSFILACQRLGYSLSEIAAQLDDLPDGRTPTDADWERLAARFRQDLDERIAGLVDLRDRLDGCIGCGCLSLDRCAIYNPSDAAAELGAGPRYLLGDSFGDLGGDPDGERAGGDTSDPGDPGGDTAET
jgi:MerR family redox-sensitive transcriptional activator SoxR